MSFPSRYFRAGVGAVISNENGLVLALERSRTSDAWQLPQGGWELNETIEMAVFREVQEETGLSHDRVVVVDRYPEPLVYELPVELQTSKTGLGQVQYWFFMRISGTDDALILPPHGEFRAWAWMPMSQLIQKVALFRRRVYERLETRL